MIRIGIDASGGDNGEIEVVKAVVDVLKKDNNVSFTIIGVKDNIVSAFESLSVTIDTSRITISDAPEKIEMNDHPVFALRTKSKSSIYIAGQLLLNHSIDIFISAGNTGALVALAQFYLKPIKGIDRPVVAAIVPTKKSPMLLIDSGCNVDSKPEWLYQYACLGNLYYKHMLDNVNPKIGLLSIGVEENKGNALTLEAYKLIKDDNQLNFIGNIEARDVPEGVCDILVTDGFAGNVFLKTYEGTAKMLFGVLKDKIKNNIIAKILILFLLPILKDVLHKFDAKIYGGAPILGANHIVLKCHGNATSIEYGYAIKQAEKLITNDINSKINQIFEVR